MKKLAGAVAFLAVALGASILGSAQEQLTQLPTEDPAVNPCEYSNLALLAWPMFRHDICHTGVGLRSLAEGKLVGAVRLKGTVSSSPALGIDFRVFGTPALIYIAENKSDPAKLHAIQSLDGKDKWAANLEENLNETSFPLVSSPALNPAATIVYVGTAGGTVFAFDAATGEEKWSFVTTDGTTNNIVVSSPVISSDGKVLYIASVGQIAGFLWALDALTGAEIWKDKDGTAYSSPALSPDGKFVYISSKRRVAVLAYDTGTHNIVWGSQLEGTTAYSSPAVTADGKVLYVGDEKNNVYAFNAVNGNQIWKTPLFPEGMVRSSPAIGLDGFVYVGSSNGNLYKINAANGRLSNSFKTGGAITSSPAVGSSSIIYVGSDDKNVYAIETLTMKEVWRFTTKGPVRSSPATGPFSNTNGGPRYVIIGSDDGVIYVIK